MSAATRQGVPIVAADPMTARQMPATRAFAITPADDADLGDPVRALYIGGTGDLVLIPRGQTDPVTLVGLPGGVLLPIETKRVLATGTTATNIVGLI
jgi:hypothetical protein